MDEIVLTEEAKVLEPEIPEVEVPAPEPEVVLMIKSGIVCNCRRVNIREHPDKNANVVTVVAAGSVLTIDAENVYDEWYAVHTQSGEFGYCMKDFVAIST